MPVTIKQIAIVAGVSRGTVDRVLHNRPGVNPKIAEHVRKIADDMGFLPNKAGRILAARKQPIKIGCFLPSIGNPFFDDVIVGMRQAEDELTDFGLTLELKEAEGYDASIHVREIEALVKSGCDALCISTVDTPATCKCINRIIDSGAPVITVNTDITGTGRLCYVGSDYLRGGATAAGLLSLMRPENLNLLIVTGSLKVKGHNDRVRGFSQTLRQKNISYKLVDVFETLDNNTRAHEMTLKIFAKHPEINCVYIAAAGVEGTCRAIVELGRHKDIYILTHDEIKVTRGFVQDDIIDFTVGQEPIIQGYKSVHLMFDYFLGNKNTIPDDFITGTLIKIKENID